MKNLFEKYQDQPDVINDLILAAVFGAMSSVNPNVYKMSLLSGKDSVSVSAANALFIPPPDPTEDFEAFNEMNDTINDAKEIMSLLSSGKKK